MTKRIYCDRHIPSALRGCPRCIEEENDRLRARIEELEQERRWLRCPQCDQLRLELGEARREAKRWLSLVSNTTSIIKEPIDE